MLTTHVHREHTLDTCNRCGVIACSNHQKQEGYGLTTHDLDHRKAIQCLTVYIHHQEPSGRLVSCALHKYKLQRRSRRRRLSVVYTHVCGRKTGSTEAMRVCPHRWYNRDTERNTHVHNPHSYFEHFSSCYGKCPLQGGAPGVDAQKQFAVEIKFNRLCSAVEQLIFSSTLELFCSQS